MFLYAHLIVLSVNLDSLSETTSLKAEFAPAGEEDSRSLFLLGTRPAELNYSEWVQGEAIYLSGYLGAAGHQIQQLSVFESTIDKYVESEYPYSILFFLILTYLFFSASVARAAASGNARCR